MKIRPIVERVSLYGAALLWLAADAIDRLFEKRDGFEDVVRPAQTRKARRKKRTHEIDASIVTRSGHA